MKPDKIKKEQDKQEQKLSTVENRAARLFGLTENQKPELSVFLPCLKIKPGMIISLTGDSGTGKTSCINQITAVLPESLVNIDDISYLPDESAFAQIYMIIKAENVETQQSSDELICKALKFLSLAGLAEAGLIFRAVRTYSAGEFFRFKIALALSRNFGTLLIDEFGAHFDKYLTCNIAFSLHRFAKQHGITLILASCNDYFLADLSPDVSFKINHFAARKVKKFKSKKRLSYFRELKIERANSKIWADFAKWHYRSHNLGPVSDIFSLTLKGTPVGIVVYGYPPMYSAPRNIALNDRFSSGVENFTKLLNDEVRIIRRIVIAPNFRGVGLAENLIRKSIKLLPDNIKYIECLTTMGEYSGFLKNAEFEYVARTETPKVVKNLNNFLAQHNWGEQLFSQEGFETWQSQLDSDDSKQFHRMLVSVIKLWIKFSYPNFRRLEITHPKIQQRWARFVEEVFATRNMQPAYYLFRRLK